MREPFSQFNIVLPEFSESEKKQSEMKTLVPKKKSMFSALFKKNRAEVCSVCGKPIKAGQIYRDKNNGHCCEECYLKDHPPRKEPLIHERLRDAHIKLEIEKLLQDKLENANLEIRQCDPLDLGPCSGTGQDWEIKEAAKRYLPDNLDTPKAQLEILNYLSNVMDVYAVKKKVESAWQINTHSSRAEVAFKLARLKTALTVNQELSFQKPSFLKRRVAEASYEDLLKSWVILDYYQLLIRQVCSLYIDHHPHSSPDMGSKCYQNIMTLQCFILNKLKNGSNVLTPESGLETDDGVLRLITLRESSVYLNSNALKIWVRFHSTSSEYSFNKTIPLNENELTLSLYDDGVKVRQYTLETEDNDDFSGKFFHLCVRLNHVGNPPIPVAQIDGFISDSSEDQKMGLNDIGYRMEAYFLSCGGEAREQRIKMMRGQDLVVKGLKYPGYTTPANVRLIGICPECGKSFCFHGYAFYMGQEDVAYSDDGLSCCSISAYAPIDKEKWTYEVDGITFRYYNSFNCPHCGTPYIDYKSHPEIKNFGVSGCVLLGRKHYTFKDET